MRWHGQVLRNEGGDMSRRALEFEVEGQIGVGGCKRHHKETVDRRVHER